MTGIGAFEGSTVILDGANISDNGGYGIETDGTCNISAKRATISRNELGGVSVKAPADTPPAAVQVKGRLASDLMRGVASSAIWWAISGQT